MKRDQLMPVFQKIINLVVSRATNLAGAQDYFRGGVFVRPWVPVTPPTDVITVALARVWLPLLLRRKIGCRFSNGFRFPARAILAIRRRDGRGADSPPTCRRFYWKMVGKLNKNKFRLKNWLAKTSTTGHLANKSPAGAIVGGFPSKYATIPLKGGFLAVVETGNALQSKTRRLFGFFRPEIPANYALTAGRTVLEGQV